MSTFIYEKIKIVTRLYDTNIKQGFVVDANNEETLKTAINWAGPKYEILEYDNKGFKLSLYNPASYSSQGGKLSFWDCLITTPDNKEILVGINTFLLFNLLETTTFVKGKCKDDIVFYREGNQLGAGSVNDKELFEKHEKYSKVKNAKMTSKYEPGTVVGTITTQQLYFGQVYQYGETDGGYNPTFTIFTEPKLVHLYVEYHEGKIDTNSIYSFMLSTRKLPRKLTGIKINVDFKTIQHQQIDNNNYSNYYAAWKQLIGLDKDGFNEVKLKEYLDTFINNNKPYESKKYTIINRKNFV